MSIFRLIIQLFIHLAVSKYLPVIVGLIGICPYTCILVTEHCFVKTFFFMIHVYWVYRYWCQLIASNYQ
jgi:hypothetical protein